MKVARERGERVKGERERERGEQVRGCLKRGRERRDKDRNRKRVGIERKMGKSGMPSTWGEREDTGTELGCVTRAEGVLKYWFVKAAMEVCE